jgi:ABC-type Fe3+-hydroxamate transport system substrate-binding protein
MLALALLSACSANTPPEATVAATSSVATPAPAADASPRPVTTAAMPTPATVATPSAPTTAFVDKVWRVAPSSAQQPGTTYTFLSGGTLVIDAPGGTPMTGAWRQVDGRLTMVEEGIAYPTDIVELDATHLVLRSHNPGGAVLIPLVAAPGEPLPRPATR